MNKIIFPLFFILTSCSFFIEKLDTKLVDEKNYLKNIPLKPSFCQIENKIHFQLVGGNSLAQKSYKEVTSTGPYDFLDHFALWSLAQISIRPDQSSPSSRAQVMLLIQNKTHYFDFFSEVSENQYPYLYGIEWVLKKFGKKTTLEQYADILDQMLSGKIVVDKDFENFLLKNKATIKSNLELNPFFFRGIEVLKENEKIPAVKYSGLIKLYRKSYAQQKIIINTALTPFTSPNKRAGKCNYDFNLYDNSIFLIDKSVPDANIFGLSLKDKAFMTATSQRLNEITALNGYPIFKGVSKVRSSAVCIVENETSSIWAFSNRSRDPGQHLFHLVRYGLTKSQTIPDVEKLIRHSRHLFLSDPVRLIIESRRSHANQIENLLKLNLPIYNADKLGNIWAFAKFNSIDRFIIDERNEGSFLCH